MYAGGRFEQVTNASGSHRFDRMNLMAFDAEDRCDAYVVRAASQR